MLTVLNVVIVIGTVAIWVCFTPTNISEFWQAIEATAVIVAGSAIFYDIRQSKQQEREMKFRGYAYVIDEVLSKEFWNHVGLIEIAWRDGTEKSAVGATENVLHVLYRLNLVQYWIDQEYIDTDVLLLAVGGSLNRLEFHIRNFEKQNKLPSLEIIKGTEYKLAYKLLNSARVWKLSQDQQIFDASKK